MKIIITESQYQKLTEEKLREFLYSFWNSQKKHGETPSLDDMLFRILDINKETGYDLYSVRPLWYEYNGGYDVLYDKVKNDIDTKEFNLVNPDFNLDTTIKVVDIVNVGQFIEIMVDVDPRGSMDFHGWDEETDEEYVVNDTIDAAYQEALSNYETGDLMGMIRSDVYDFFYNLLEKYGIPIEVDIELEEIHGAPYSLNENFFDEMDGIKAITKYWKSKLKKGEEITFDKDELEYFNITEFSPKLHAQEIFYDLIGGDDYTDKFIKGLLNKTFSTQDFNEKLIGGYNFKWVINEFEYQDYRYKLYGDALPGGTVLMMDGRTLNLDVACNLEDFGWAIQDEVNDVVQDCMKEIITTKTGAHIEIPLIIVPEE